jgi:hypothetical protein
VLGMPLTGLALVITLWVVARLHRHRSAGSVLATGPGAASGDEGPAAGERPAA